jgi:UDP-glucose 4-epimerase
VTGAAGFIGQHLCRVLLANGSSVRGIDDERCGDWSRVDASVERIVQPLEQMSQVSLLDACTDVDVLFHLAAEKHNSPRATPETLIDVNITATQRLVDAAASAQVRKFVFASSLYAYGGLGPAPMSEADTPAPATVYGLTKLAGEHLLRAADRSHRLPWCGARLFFVYGPGQYAEGGYKSVLVRNFERILRGEPPVIFGDGEQRLDYVYIDDCIEALLTMSNGSDPGRVYNVASGRGMSVKTLTQMMLDAAGSELEPVYGPADWTHGTARIGTRERAERELGWTPSIPIDEGVRKLWEWMAATG